jgi:hypothetical protein
MHPAGYWAGAGEWSVTIEIVSSARAAGSLARRAVAQPDGDRATRFNPQEQV